jgi:RimK family alpha-L-glutamate ligase
VTVALAPSIAIVTDDPGWHGRVLAAAFARRGLGTRMVSLTECSIDLGGARPKIKMPGFEEHALQGVFVRGVPGGTLEQVILRLDILHALKALGVPVYNHGRAIEKSVDKAMTSVLLACQGIPTPPTWIMESRAAAEQLLRQKTMEGKRLVLKPLFGSQGNGLMLLDHALPSDKSCYRGVWYLQQFVEPRHQRFSDWRVMVLGNRVDCAMMRHGTHWINNVAQGGRCEACVVSPELERLALDAARALNMDYAGVDIIEDAQGRFQVLEVNSIPAWHGLQSVTHHSIAEHLVEDFIGRASIALEEAM